MSPCRTFIDTFTSRLLIALAFSRHFTFYVYYSLAASANLGSPTWMYLKLTKNNHLNYCWNHCIGFQCGKGSVSNYFCLFELSHLLLQKNGINYLFILDDHYNSILKKLLKPICFLSMFLPCWNHNFVCTVPIIRKCTFPQLYF